MLTLKDKDRYSRSIKLNNFNLRGQEKISSAKVLCVGAGGLASSLLIHLATSGVGEIAIIDFDNVSLSNLQRQIIHSEAFINQPKVNSAINALQRLNSDIIIKGYNGSIAEHEELFKQYHFIATTVDDISTRFIINQLALKHQCLQIVGAVVGYEGYITTFKHYQSTSPCYHCLQSNDTNNIIKKAQDIGVLAPLVGLLSSAMSLEMIREIIGLKNGLNGKIKVMNALDNFETIFKIAKNPHCPTCNLKH